MSYPQSGRESRKRQRGASPPAPQRFRAARPGDKRSTTIGIASARFSLPCRLAGEKKPTRVKPGHRRQEAPQAYSWASHFSSRRCHISGRTKPRFKLPLSVSLWEDAFRVPRYFDFGGVASSMRKKPVRLRSIAPNGRSRTLIGVRLFLSICPGASTTGELRLPSLVRA